MSRFFHPLLFMLACSSKQDLARQLHYLKIENEILRGRLPKRIVVKPEERRRLINAAKELGGAIKGLVSIVKPKTFMDWVNAEKGPDGKKPSGRTPGRPRTPDEIRQLIVLIAKDTGWGYTRILGELRKLGIGGVTRQTVKNILKEHGYDPGPHLGEGSWDEFIKMHAASLWQCDFFSKRIWTITGLRQCFALTFINIATRKVFITPCSFKPDAAWMKRQAEAFVNHAQTEGIPLGIVQRDNDCMYVKDFTETLTAAGAQVKKTRPCSPNLQAYVERFVQTIQQECLDHFVVLGQKHFDHLIAEFLAYYHTDRPHQSLGNMPLGKTESPSKRPLTSMADVVCLERLGGLLRHYEWKAARSSTERQEINRAGNSRTPAR